MGHELREVEMWQDREELLFDLVTRDALLIWNGQAHRLEWPFRSLTDAEDADDELKRRMLDPSSILAA